jgi:hypothetical protein
MIHPDFGFVVPPILDKTGSGALLLAQADGEDWSER